MHPWKGFVPCCVLAGLIGLVSFSQPILAQVVARKVASTTSSDDKSVEALCKILDSTMSIDTFRVTIMLLSAMQSNTSVVIPKIIENAERLGIFADHLGKEGKEAELAKEIMEVLANMAQGKARLGGSARRQPDAPDAPDAATVLAALPDKAKGSSVVYQETRDNIRIVCEKIVDRLDEPRSFPLVGPARLRHLHWKCTLYYTQHLASTYPIPFEVAKPRVQVVYIDRDRLEPVSASSK